MPGFLQLHPGIGPVISLAFVLTVGEVSRFESSRQLVSYLGLKPSEDSSGERRGYRRNHNALTKSRAGVYFAPFGACFGLDPVIPPLALVDRNLSPLRG